MKEVREKIDESLEGELVERAKVNEDLAKKPAEWNDLSTVPFVGETDI